ncbi:MAG: HDOD domain-containing protein [Terriglobales bacterium]
MSKNKPQFPGIALRQDTELGNSFPELEAAAVEGTSIPDLPILPTTLAQLDALLADDVVDLTALTNVVRSDLGLTIHLIRITRNADWASRAVPRITEIVVGLGIKHLKAIVRDIPVLPTQPRDLRLLACVRFWMHAQLTGLITEELASYRTNVNCEDSYIAGLLCQIGKLPILLGWKIPELESSDVASLGGALARAWGFPAALQEVIDGDRRPTSPASQSLRQVVTAARDWVHLLELTTANSGEPR